MQYFWNNKETLENMDNAAIKQLATCTTPTNEYSVPLPNMNRTCFDEIGVPIKSYDVFGDIKCANGEYSDDCLACEINASGL